MRIHLSDSKWACISGLCLSGLAFFVVLVIRPGGFETQIGWFVALLPGALVGFPISDFVYKLAPGVERFVFWILLIGLDFLWYAVISYVLIKIWRFAGRTFRA
jgi:hypothetical protein